jgi:hypothetical protein
MYNKSEYSELVDKFIEFNKVGDEVEIEFTVRGREYNGKIYNSFSHWRCDKIKEADKAKQTEPVESDLPF